MSGDPTAPHRSTPIELKQRLEAERAGYPFLLYRVGDGGQEILGLTDELNSVSVGRDSAATVSISWDRKVSRLHAVLEQIGESWTITDDGLSRNGTFVNHERLTGRRTLRANDLIQVGDTEIRFFRPAATATEETSLAVEARIDADLSRMQRQVLIELCRPLHTDNAYASPATNQEIADAVHLSTVAVKTHLRTLFAKFGLSDLPQNRKRAALAEAALRSGAISARDF